MAAILFLAIGLGVSALYLPRGVPLRVELLTLHKSLGLTALALVIVRAPLRLIGGTPPYGPAVGPVNRLVAALAHLLLYAAMIAVPVSGYVHSMAGKHGFDWFGLFPVPDLVPPSEAVDAAAGQAHYALNLILGALVAAHLAAGYWHARLRRDGVFERVWP